MELAQIRLECIKLAYRTDFLPQDRVFRAKIYEEYVLENLATSPVTRERPIRNKPATVARNDPE